MQIIIVTFVITIFLGLSILISGSQADDGKEVIFATLMSESGEQKNFYSMQECAEDPECEEFMLDRLGVIADIEAMARD